MALFVWAAASAGNWSVGSNWKVGGVVQASPPTTADAVQLGTGTGATQSSCTIDVATNAIVSLDCTGYTGTMTHSTLANTISVTGNVTLVAGMTYTSGGQWDITGTCSFATGGKTLGGTLFVETGAALTHADAFTSTGAIQVNGGTWNTGSKAISLNNFVSTANATRTITLGSSSIAITGTGQSWNLITFNNVTMTASTATITLSGAGATFQTSSMDYNGASLVINNGGAITGPSGTLTFANFTITGTATKTYVHTWTGTVLTITGTFTLTGNSAVNRILFQSNAPNRGSVSAATVSLTNADFMDITGTGAATWSGTSIGDAGGNAGITFTPSVAPGWSGNTTGAWSTAANWSTGKVPLPQDDVAISGLTSGTITADMPRLGRNISFTGSTGGTLTWSTNSSVYGSLTMASGMATSGTAVQTFRGRGAQTLTSHAVAFTNAWVTHMPGGTLTLQDKLTINVAVAVTQGLQLGEGTFDANGQDVSVLSMVLTTLPGTQTATLKMGSGTWTVSGAANTGAGYVFGVGVTTGWTVQGQTSTIVLSDTGNTAKTFQGGGFAWNNLSITGGGTGAVTVTGSSTFSTVTIGAPKTVTFTAGTTQTITTLNITGTSGNVITLQSSVAGTTFTLSVTNRVSGDWLSVRDSTAAGAFLPFIAGANSTFVSNVVNWSLVPPAVLSAGSINVIPGINYMPGIC